jgi:hypothetical protein
MRPTIASTWLRTVSVGGRSMDTEGQPFARISAYTHEERTGKRYAQWGEDKFVVHVRKELNGSMISHAP